MHGGLTESRFRLLALGHFALVVATWPLWTPQDAFPQIPFISIAGAIPRSVEWGLLALLLASCAVMAFANRPMWQRSASLSMGLSTGGLVLIDQHRLQPWAWQFLILSLVLATARASVASAAWRWLVIGIYAWSAWSKLDHSFCVEHGPFLLDGFFRSLGLMNGAQVFPGSVRYGMAAAIPIVELLIAACLPWQKTRRVAVIAAAVMHLGLLLALGPLGHGHQSGVLIWNLFFLIQNWFLFVRSPVVDRALDDAVPAKRNLPGNVIAGLIVAFALAWPLLEPFGYCDHWPAWAVYAAKPERVHFLVNETEVAKLPANLQRYLQAADFDGWHLFRMDRWSLDAVHAPIYPQDRFQVGIALWLAREYELDQIRVVIQGPANRWSGKRSEREYLGHQSIERRAATYRLNATPSARE